MLRGQLTKQFEHELGSRGKGDAKELVSALELACSFESIEYLRVVEGISAQNADSVVNRTILALLAES